MENLLISILRITSPQLGSFVKDQLESNGIEVFFTNEDLLSGNNYDYNKVLLKVKAHQSEEAVKTLLQIHKEYDLDKIETDQSLANQKKILVPITLSPNCIDLCEYAMKLAIKINAEIKLLYIYEDPTFHQPERNTASWDKYVKIELQEAHQNAQKKLVEFSREIKTQISKDILEKAKFHYRLLKGTPQNVISDACKRYNPNLMIMGTWDTKSKSGEFSGKTLIKILEQAHYPILALPTSASFKEKEKINVMYATNFYEADNSSLNKLLKLLQSFNKEIHCIHINLQDDPHLQKKVDKLNEMLKKEYSEYNIECKLFESENLINGFNDFVKKNNIDIISMSKIRHSALYKMFHTDLLKKLVAREKVPILIFPV